MLKSTPCSACGKSAIIYTYTVPLAVPDTTVLLVEHEGEQELTYKSSAAYVI